jgi:hypothetical protein
MSADGDLGETVKRTVALLIRWVSGDHEPFNALHSHETDVTDFEGFGAY